MRFLAWLKNPPSLATLEDLFGIDLRALAIIRILIAIFVLYELTLRVPFLTVFYGDTGILPSDAAWVFWDPVWIWSFHLWDNGSLFVLIPLFALHAFAAVCLLVGYRTRAATILVWILTISLQNANSLIVSGDTLLRPVLFVAMFLPWGARFSIDAARGLYAEAKTRVVSAWSAAYLLQLAFLYLFAVLYKDAPEWIENGTAVYYALSLDEYATPVAMFLLGFPYLTSLLTFAIVIVQLTAPLLLFFPLWTRSVRVAALAGLMCMHIGFIACLHLNDFSWMMLTVLLAFVPSVFWDRVGELSIAQSVKIRGTMFRRLIPEWVVYPSTPIIREKSGAYREPVLRIVRATGFSLGIAYILYIVLWQAVSIPRLQGHVNFPSELAFIGNVLRLDQQWRLFSPHPPKIDGWLIARGIQEGGGEIDVIQQGRAVSYEKPDNIPTMYGNARWRKYIMNITGGGYDMYRLYYAAYLCRSWNHNHVGDDMVTEIELIYMYEETPSPEEPPLAPYPVSLLKWKCDTQI